MNTGQMCQNGRLLGGELNRIQSEVTWRIEDNTAALKPAHQPRLNKPVPAGVVQVGQFQTLSIDLNSETL